MLWAQSTTKDYIRAEHKLHSLHQGWTQTSLYIQVINFTSHHTISQIFEAICIPRAVNTETCIRQGDLFYSAGLHRNHELATANTEEIGRGFGKNAGEWTGIGTEEIPGSKRRMCSYILTYWL